MSINGNVANGDNETLKGKVKPFPSIDKTLSKEGCCADAKATGDALEARVKKVDIVDNLTTEDSEKPLSAKQGAELKKQLDALTALVNQ